TRGHRVRQSRDVVQGMELRLAGKAQAGAVEARYGGAGESFHDEARTRRGEEFGLEFARAFVGLSARPREQERIHALESTLDAFARGDHLDAVDGRGVDRGGHARGLGAAQALELREAV